MVGEAGLEPTTPGLEGRCSIQLSYSPQYASFYLRVAAQCICKSFERRSQSLRGMLL
jgi:hypothetical protein